jgi:uncharacterized protein (TIRG00374 family)
MCAARICPASRTHRRLPMTAAAVGCIPEDAMTVGRERHHLRSSARRALTPTAGLASLRQHSQKGVPGSRRKPKLWIVLVSAVCFGMVLTWKSSLLDASLQSFDHLQWAWFVPAVGFEAASMAAFVRMQRLVLQSEGFPFTIRSMIAITYASNAISVSLPLAGGGFGAAFTYRQLSAHGAPRSVVAWVLTITGILSTFSFALTVCAGAIVSGDRAAEVAGITGIVLIAVPTLLILMALQHDRSRRFLVAALAWTFARISRLTPRLRREAPPDMTQAVTQFGSHRLALGAQVKATLLAFGNWLFDIACLAFAIKAVGLPVPWTVLILAWSAGVSAASFNLTPGGLGVTEAALAAALVAGHLPAAHAMAAVLVYRLISFWLVLLVGWCSYLLIRRQPKSAPRERLQLST